MKKEIPYIGYSKDALAGCPTVRAGQKIKCPHCGKRHVLHASKVFSDKTGKYEKDGTLLYYNCHKIPYLAAIDGKLIIKQEPDVSGDIKLGEEDRYVLKDSGKREKYKSGAVRDARRGKGRFDLISPFALMRLARIYEKGSIKYAERNWEKGMPHSRFIDSALRHIAQFIMGYEDEDHLAQAAWNLFAIMHLQKTHPELNDLPHYIRNEHYKKEQ